MSATTDAVRVIMLTGDHPATARAVAEQAGLRATPDALLTGAELADLDDRELDRRLERATVIARITSCASSSVYRPTGIRSR
jgi:Ca2+-transporting ATPase